MFCFVYVCVHVRDVAGTSVWQLSPNPQGWDPPGIEGRHPPPPPTTTTKEIVKEGRKFLWAGSGLAVRVAVHHEVVLWLCLEGSPALALVGARHLRTTELI